MWRQANCPLHHNFRGLKQKQSVIPDWPSISMEFRNLTHFDFLPWSSSTNKFFVMVCQPFFLPLQSFDQSSSQSVESFPTKRQKFCPSRFNFIVGCDDNQKHSNTSEPPSELIAEPFFNTIRSWRMFYLQLILMTSLRKNKFSSFDQSGRGSECSRKFSANFSSSWRSFRSFWDLSFTR